MEKALLLSGPHPNSGRAAGLSLDTTRADSHETSGS